MRETLQQLNIRLRDEQLLELIRHCKETTDAQLQEPAKELECCLRNRSCDKDVDKGGQVVERDSCKDCLNFTEFVASFSAPGILPLGGHREQRWGCLRHDVTNLITFCFEVNFLCIFL